MALRWVKRAHWPAMIIALLIMLFVSSMLNGPLLSSTSAAADAARRRHDVEKDASALWWSSSAGPAPFGPPLSSSSSSSSSLSPSPSSPHNNDTTATTAAAAAATTTTTTRFVTAWIDLPASNSTAVKAPLKRLQFFTKLAASGVPLLVFVSPTYLDHMRNVSATYPNIAKVVPIEWREMETYRIVQGFPNLRLPAHRSVDKDTSDYITLQLSKMEFLEMALQHTEASHLAWIDFNVAHVFRSEAPFQVLRGFQGRNFGRPALIFAGIWHRGVDVQLSALLDKVNWRFAGGFFLADRESVSDVFALACDALAHFLRETGTLVWEVNFWAWMEDTYVHAFRPQVFMADHGDRLVAVPERIEQPKA